MLTIVQRGEEQGRAWRCSDEKSSWVQLDLAPDEAEGTPGDRGRREMIFVLDCSGSMQGDSIDQAKRALEVCLKALESGCTLQHRAVRLDVRVLFPGPREYGERSLGEALGWLAAVNADLGGTEVLAPLTGVYKAPVARDVARSVVLLTDGQVGNEASRDVAGQGKRGDYPVLRRGHRSGTERSPRAGSGPRGRGHGCLHLPR